MIKLKIATITSLLCLSITGIAFAGDMESKETKIARAVSAAPGSISDKATVMDLDGAILREGSNGWTCMPGVRLIPGNKFPMCNDATWMAWMKAAANNEPFSTETIGYSYMLMGDGAVNNDDPASKNPCDGGVWVKEGPHLMLLMPKEQMEDLKNNPFAGGPYIMWGDTPLFHVMVPLSSHNKMSR